jgi:hypothetical protein
MKNATESAIIARTANANTKLPLYSLNFLVIWYIFTQIRVFINRSVPTQTNVTRNTKIKPLKNCVSCCALCAARTISDY